MKFVFNKQSFQDAIQPHSISDILYDIRMTPAQMTHFFRTEPSVEKLKKLREILPAVDWLSLCEPEFKKGEKKDEPNQN